MDMMHHRGNFPVSECITVVRPEESPKEGYYRPYLVGPDFLYRVGGVRIN